MSTSTMLASVTGASGSAAASGKISPSKIPGSSRLPMSAMRDGNNSPERRLRAAQSEQVLGNCNEDLSSTLRGRSGPPRAPPPKMKDLFIPPTSTPGSNTENGGFDHERSASVVRHLEPEDPYDDHSTNYRSLQSSTMQPPPRPQYARSQDSFTSSVAHSTHPAHSSRPMSRQDYPVAPPSRQTSNTSSTMSGSQVSGSENWETYTDNSDCDEADATQAYYAKLKAQQLRQQPLKRPATSHAQFGAPKRVRESPIAEEGVVEGSDAGWTDAGDLGDTY